MGRYPNDPEQKDNSSVAVWDLAPDGGGAPGQFQALKWYADELVAAQPQRYRLALPGDVTPTERSDGQPIKSDGGQ